MRGLLTAAVSGGHQPRTHWFATRARSNRRL